MKLSHRITFDTHIGQWDTKAKKSLPTGGAIKVSGLVYRSEYNPAEYPEDIDCDIDSIIWDGKEVVGLFQSLDQLDDIKVELQQRGFEYFKDVPVSKRASSIDWFELGKILNPHQSY